MSKIKIFNYLLSLILLLSVFDSRAQTRLKGWKITTNKTSISYSPKNLDKILFFVTKPEIVNQKKEWLLTTAQNITSKYNTSGKWKIYKERDNQWSCSQTIKVNNSKIFLSFKTEKFSDNESFIIGMIGNPKLVLKYYKYYKQINNDAKKRFKEQIIRTTAKTAKKDIKSKEKDVVVKSDISNSQPVKSPDNFMAIWSITKWTYITSTNMWGIKETIVAAFADGRMTTDLHAVFGGNRKIKFNGQWRKRNGKIETRWKPDKKFSKTEFSVTTKPGKKDQRLEGCYKMFQSFNNPFYNEDFSFAAVKTWCFTKDGRFAVNVTSTASVPVAYSKIRRKTSGSYRIDGYGMRLIFDDGTVRYSGFAFLGSENTITINGNRLKKK